MTALKCLESDTNEVFLTEQQNVLVSETLARLSLQTQNKQPSGIKRRSNQVPNIIGHLYLAMRGRRPCLEAKQPHRINATSTLITTSWGKACVRPRRLRTIRLLEKHENMPTKNGIAHNGDAFQEVVNGLLKPLLLFYEPFSIKDRTPVPHEFPHPVGVAWHSPKHLVNAGPSQAVHVHIETLRNASCLFSHGPSSYSLEVG